MKNGYKVCHPAVIFLFALLVALTLLLRLAGSSYAGEISGVIVDLATKQPVVKAEVFLYHADAVKGVYNVAGEVAEWRIDKTQSAYSDNDGRFSFGADDGFYAVVVLKKGYFPYWYEERFPMGALDVLRVHDYAQVRLIIKMMALPPEKPKTEDLLAKKKK